MVLLVIDGPDKVVTLTGAYVVVAGAADHLVVAIVAVDDVVTIAAFDLVAAPVAVEIIVVGETLYQVAKVGRFLCAFAIDVIAITGTFEGIGILGTATAGVASLGHPLTTLVSELLGSERHARSQRQDKRHGAQQ